MIRITNRAKCCGCGACADACLHSAIVMKEDGMGFPYPVTNEENCTGCGLCERVCAFSNDTKGRQPLAVYAARHKELHQVELSRSGAVFPALADAVLAEEGYIYGAALQDSGRSVKHLSAHDKSECNTFRGSKYIQSGTTGVFSSVKSALAQGENVLFSGTPCQCAALLAFMKGRNSEKLFTMDFICHGTAAPSVWKEYVEYISVGKKIVSASFRDKEHFGWKAHRESFRFEDGSYKSSRSFTDLYYKHIIHRPSCASCPYASTERVSDITVADFWGWERAVPRMNADDKGCSVVMVNTEKGRSLFDRAAKELQTESIHLEQCMQPGLQSSIRLSAFHEEFEKLFLAGVPIRQLLRKYGDHNWKSQTRYAYKAVRKWLRRKLKCV